MISRILYLMAMKVQAQKLFKCELSMNRKTEPILTLHRTDLCIRLAISQRQLHSLTLLELLT